ncbi:VWA domain-containing protein [Membranicola marinus]|uniref:VWA domain-containing protein n=1 Tax=Membranihabitans marinus TaxID=1227546 RepID=A0A953L7W4_9BACT|nr:VWA domain-containing protein [Membranihabitans marinus]MBY5959142.1 VWA domain-containing protein [Membranihabitans marinus]
MTDSVQDTELVRKWRLILGPEAETTDEVELDENAKKTDRTLSLLFDQTENDLLKRSRPQLNEWLRDIRELFPKNQTLFLQKEAIEKMQIGSLLFEKEVFDSLTPDIDLIRTILELKDQIPPDRMDDIHSLVRQYAAEIEDKIHWALQNTLNHLSNKGNPTTFPRKQDIDWPKTIKRNLRHYQSDLQSIIIKNKYGYERKRQGFPNLILAVDSSGSMMESMIYSAIIASIMAHIRTIETRLIVFDHEVADLSDHLDDIVNLLFHIHLGGGTNIRKTLRYIHENIKNPDDTYLFLISDLYDNRTDEGVYDKMRELQKEGVKIHCILSMQNEGKIRYNKPLAAQLTHAGIPCYSSSPDQFPEALKKALER